MILCSICIDLNSMLLLVIQQQSETKRSTEKNFNSLSLLPGRLCVYRHIWWIFVLSLRFSPSSSFITFCLGPHLVNLFMIWAELLSEEFLKEIRFLAFFFRFVLSNFFVISRSNPLKTKKTDDFMRGWIEGISGFVPAKPHPTSFAFMFLSWVTHRAHREIPFAISFMSTVFFFVGFESQWQKQHFSFLLHRQVRQCETCCSNEMFFLQQVMAFFYLPLLPLILALIDGYTGRIKKAAKKMLLALLVCCLPFRSDSWDGLAWDKTAKWMSNDFNTLIRESTDSFDTTVSLASLQVFSLLLSPSRLNCIECQRDVEAKNLFARWLFFLSTFISPCATASGWLVCCRWYNTSFSLVNSTIALLIPTKHQQIVELLLWLQQPEPV